MNRSNIRVLIEFVAGLGLVQIVSSLLGLRPEFRGVDGVAGAMLVGSALITRAILERGPTTKPEGKPAFHPDDLMADALDRRDD